VVFTSVDVAVASASAAQKLFQALALEQRRSVVAALRVAAVQHSARWAQLTVAETKMGRVDDKTEKNLLCARRTPGVEDLSTRATVGDQGLTLVEYAPFGVVASVTPSNNPVATLVSNAIGILAAGNSVVFAPHPAAAMVSIDCLRILAAATLTAGAPPGLITTVFPSTNASTQELLAHPGVALNLVTGGPAIVDVAMATGKVCKTIAAGPGNPPVVVDATAIFPACVDHIVRGASFDNNLLCIAEKVVIVVEAAREPFLAALRQHPRTHELSPALMDDLAALAFLPGHDPLVPVLNRQMVGRDASVLAQAVNLPVPETVRLLWGLVAPDHPFVLHEQLMPVVPVIFAQDVDEAIVLARRVEGENHHSAAMHSQDIGNITKMARALECSVFVNNAPTSFGLGMGDGFASMSIGTPTGDGITKASHFVRPLQLCLVGSFRIT
jgi:aldehyde dehydrogenase